MKRFIIAAIAASISMTGMAQETTTVTGKLTMLGDLPVQNMKVTSSITGDTAVSNKSGIFEINTRDKDIISISCYPFKPVKYKVKLATAIKDSVKIGLTIPRKATLLTQVMDNGYLDTIYEQVAYGRLTFTKDWTKYTDISQAIAVEFPTLQLVRTGCYQMPGNTSPSGDGCMLAVVGNRPVDPSDLVAIPISNVEDIYILKGAQATVWGVRGSNGVLVVKIKNTDSDLDTRDKN